MKKKYMFPIVLCGIISICVVAILFLNAGECEQASITPANNRDYYPTVKQAFAGADESIHIALYGAKYYENPKDDNEWVNDLYSELENAVARGVDVKVVFDEEWDNIAETAIKLNSIGADVVFDSDEVRTHAKFIVVDGELVIIGSSNWSYHSLQKNNEANVLIHSKDIAEQYEDYFDELWS